ncbi:MAG: PEP-CTERM sorting domain-containing protein [Verrucomicrobiae bacterium]|nr:PEP-CTERM sorting domain-containing protein [Verrucomicrobiae bacterium]NNJ43310.1 PEP-CTERM sorting domain-containing protein [Akkermansiaceae bacterium]
MKEIIIISLAAALTTSALSAATTLTVGATAPTNILDQNTNFSDGNFTFSRSEGTNGEDYRDVRGQVFNLGGSSSDLFDVTSISIIKSRFTTAHGVNDSLSISVFEYGAGYTSGDGHGDGDFFDGTGLTTLLVDDSVSLNGVTTTNQQYINFNFDTALSMSGDKDYGFLVGFKGTSDSNILWFERYVGGTELASLGTSDTAHSTGDLDVEYVISGTAIPEPSTTALLGLGGLALILRRRK